MGKSKRLLKGTVYSLILVLFYLFIVLPANHFVNNSSFCVTVSPHYAQGQLCVNHNISGVLNIKTPSKRSAYIGGFPLAMALYTDGVIIDEISAVDTAFGRATPASQLMRGDFLIELDGKKISGTNDVDSVLDGLGVNASQDFKAYGLRVMGYETANADLNLVEDKQLCQCFMLGNLSSNPLGKKKNKARKKLFNKKKGKKNMPEDANQNSNEGKKIDKDSFLGKGVKSSEIGVTVLRNGEKKQFKIKPALEEFSNKYRLGLVVRDYVLGVGMVSFIKEDGSFGALGHPITDSVAGKVPIKGGSVFKCGELGIVKGERGKPGELRVKISSTKSPVGEIYRNTEYGVYGRLNVSALKTAVSADSKPLPVSPRKNVSMGGAYIYTTINDVSDFYRVEIIRTVGQINCADKGMVVRITDKRLLEKTGGIIQGMSGSPIVQNNMIIGAVTHVFVNEPTKGYGIYADFMFDL